MLSVDDGTGILAVQSVSNPFQMASATNWVWTSGSCYSQVVQQCGGYYSSVQTYLYCSGPQPSTLVAASLVNPIYYYGSSAFSQTPNAIPILTFMVRI